MPALFSILRFSPNAHPLIINWFRRTQLDNTSGCVSRCTKRVSSPTSPNPSSINNGTKGPNPLISLVIQTSHCNGLKQATCFMTHRPPLPSSHCLHLLSAQFISFIDSPSCYMIPHLDDWIPFSFGNGCSLCTVYWFNPFVYWVTLFGLPLHMQGLLDLYFLFMCSSLWSSRHRWGNITQWWKRILHNHWSLVVGSNKVPRQCSTLHVVCQSIVCLAL